jgi:hypothetical protein
LFQRTVLGAKQPAFNPSALPTVLLNSSALSGSQTLQASPTSGTAQGGSSTSITLSSSSSATSNIYVGQRVNIVQGPGWGQTGIITAYNGSTKVATVAGGWVTSPGAPASSPTSSSLYCLVNVVNFAYYGVNPQFLAYASPTGTYTACLENYVGQTDCNTLTPFTISFQTNATSLDLISLGNSLSGSIPYMNVWVDDQFLGGYYGSALTGTAQSGSSNTLQLQSGSPAISGVYNTCWLTITGGTGTLGETKQIASYNSSTLTATISGTWSVTPDSTTTYSLNYSNSGIALPVSATRYLNLTFSKPAYRKIVIQANQFSGINVGPYDSVIPGPPNGPLTMAIVGDSYWEPTEAPNNNPGMNELLPRFLGMQSLTMGEGGTGWLNPNSGSNRLPFIDRICPPAESWKIGFTASGGTYTISVTYGGSTQTTGSLAYSASGPTVAAAINGLSNVPASSPYCLTGVATGSGYDRGQRPLILCLHSMPGATITVNTGSLTGGTAYTLPYQGDLSQHVPTSANGTVLPFLLFVPGSYNDYTGGATSSQVQTVAAYVATQTPSKFPTALTIFCGIVNCQTQGGAGVLNSSDIAWDAALNAAASGLPTLANGLSPYVTLYGQGLTGNNLITGSSSVANPTSGKTDYLNSAIVSLHPTDLGHMAFASALRHQIALLLGAVALY